MPSDPNTAAHSAEIDAPPGHVWAVVRDFGRVADWHPIASASRISSGAGDEPGAERELSLAGGGTVREELVRLDDGARTLAYRLVTFPIPVTAQANTIRVEPVASTARSRVAFSAVFSPAPGHSAGEIRAINEEAFRAAADGLARHVGRGAGAP